jgi:predicted HTH transcriptional regulator
MTESHRIEYKRILTDNFEKEVVAFLNYHEGGIIYIGRDDNGDVIGCSNIDQIQLKIKDKLKHNISPSCLGLFEVIVEKTDDKDSFKISKNFMKNVFYNENNINGGLNELYSVIQKNHGLNARQLSQKTNTPLRTIQRWLKQLRDNGKIEFRGSKKTGGYFGK